MGKKQAVVLLSGGIDSATCLLIAKENNYLPYCLTFNYKQRHAAEIKASKRIAKKYGAYEHKIIKIDLFRISHSVLISDEEVPKDRDVFNIKEIPPTYVPARNTIFLSLALGWAETIGADDIFIGVNSIDYSGYPDCRPAYIKKFEELANLATKAGVEGKLNFKIHAPLINLSKAEIIRLANEKGLDFSITHSCYDPSPEGIACGRCDSCLLRLKGFKEAGINDPIRYASLIY